MNQLDQKVTEKILEIVKPFHKQEDYELNYLITDDSITFFTSINESEPLSDDVIEQIASILDARFEKCALVNQEYRYRFNLNPCGD